VRKTVFITGGSRGIGAALALSACRRGFDVALTYAQRAEQAEEVLRQAKELAPEAKARAYALDVRDSAAVDAVADRVLEDFGGVYAVIANAGVSLNGLAYSVTDADWRTVIDTNLTGTFFVCRAFLPEMVANREGRIVMLSSVTAPGASGQAAYAASKSGLSGLAGTLAREYGRRGITANILAPGYFETDMTREGVSPEKREFALRYSPAGRAGELGELCGAALFLLSEEAAYINGGTLRVTGGLGWVP
jgi:NAD(P)-dependent dehydrogenase (short-subunit alcohol dehydrogenase family)